MAVEEFPWVSASFMTQGNLLNVSPYPVLQSPFGALAHRWNIGSNSLDETLPLTDPTAGCIQLCHQSPHIPLANGCISDTGNVSHGSMCNGY